MKSMSYLAKRGMNWQTTFRRRRPSCPCTSPLHFSHHQHDLSLATKRYCYHGMPSSLLSTKNDDGRSAILGLANNLHRRRINCMHSNNSTNFINFGWSYNIFSKQVGFFSSMADRNEESLEQDLQPALNPVDMQGIEVMDEGDTVSIDGDDAIDTTNPTDEDPLTKEERRILHEQQFDAAEERRKLHEERMQKAAQKREANRRKLLAEEMMRIFATSEDLFRMTLEEFDVVAPEDHHGDQRQEKNEYHQFYLDSLQSFGAFISEDIESNEEELQEIGLSGAFVVQMVNQFGESSLFKEDGVDLAFSKKYRKMNAAMKIDRQFQLRLKTLEEVRARRIKELEKEERVLEEMKAANENENNLPRPDPNIVKKINLNGEQQQSSEQALHSVEDEEFFLEVEDAISELTTLPPTDHDFEPAHKSLRRQQNVVNNLQHSIEMISIKIDKMKERINSIEYPMTQDEYENSIAEIRRTCKPLIPALAKFIANRHSDFEKYRRLERHTDLTRPQEWYPRARLDKRKITFHAGPTNSGKTYTALQRLKQAKKGMYLAPLRLLAAEVYENLTAEGIYTNLLTGQETREVPFSTHRSSTVELACIDQDFDVVVIDEIQMIGDSFRGYAWTRALLGVRCKEIHVCGGMEARELLEKICKMCGDDFEIKTYSRFGELRVEENTLAKDSKSKGSYSNVQPGDCVVAFSRNDLFAIKREIELTTSYKCCLIYGALPPEIRAEQARRFNDPDSGYQVLVASDAIGMGLNLSIKRVIFNTMIKNNGEKLVQLDHSLVKQIAGRAGRRNSPYPHGEVTCRDPSDLAHLKRCMSTDVPQISKAGLIPTANHIGLFTDYLKEYSTRHKDIDLHETIRKFDDMATVKGDFFICRKRSMEIVSRWLKNIPMSNVDKFMLCMSPVDESCEHSKKVFMRFVEKHVRGEVPGIPYSMRPKSAKTFDNLSFLCKVHHQLELFLWLQTKFPPNAVEQQTALAAREKAIRLINEGLLNADKLSLNHDYVYKDADLKQKWAKRMKESNLNEMVFNEQK